MDDNINGKKELSLDQQGKILSILKDRFLKNMNFHSNIKWNQVEKKLKENDEKLWSIYQMDITGGEPDVIGYDDQTDEFIFCDCSAQTPKGRRSICYDREALESRKKLKPENSAMDMAAFMGIEILTEEQYRVLQKKGEFDTKTSGWVKTPDDIRKLGGALFCDRRYNKVFVYHNSADSYYGVRGFRGMIKI